MTRTLLMLVVMTPLLGLPALPALPAGAESPALEKELQKHLESFLAENSSAPGITAYAICPPLDLDWAGATGTVARDDSTPLTPFHTARIASNTKTYVAAAVLRLMEMGHLDLDDSLGRHLTSKQKALLESDGYDTKAITIAQVLSHTAGLADHSNDDRYVQTVLDDHQYQWTSEAQIRRLVEWRDPAAKPGEKFIYSDSGYIILGTIIEEKTGLKLGPAVRKLLGFEKLGLESTYWEYMEDVPDKAGPRAHQYFGEHDVTTWNASLDLYGGGGLITNSPDLAMFTRHLLKGKVFQKDSTLVAMKFRGTETYRLGLKVMELDGRLAFGHQGFWNTFVFHVPSLDLTVSGNILSHESADGKDLADQMVNSAAAAMPRQ